MGGLEMSKDMAYILHYAVLLAELRASPILDVGDLVGGLHLQCRKRISRYWANIRDYNRFIRNLQEVQEPLRMYDDDEIFDSVFGNANLRYGHYKSYSTTIKKLLRTAKDFAAARPKGKQVLTPEDLLLAIACMPELALGKKLRSSSLDLDRLRRATTRLKPRPA